MRLSTLQDSRVLNKAKFFGSVECSTLTSYLVKELSALLSLILKEYGVLYIVQIWTLVELPSY